MGRQRHYRSGESSMYHPPKSRIHCLHPISTPENNEDGENDDEEELYRPNPNLGSMLSSCDRWSTLYPRDLELEKLKLGVPELD